MFPDHQTVLVLAEVFPAADQFLPQVRSVTYPEIYKVSLVLAGVVLLALAVRSLRS